MYKHQWIMVTENNNVLQSLPPNSFQVSTYIYIKFKNMNDVLHCTRCFGSSSLKLLPRRTTVEWGGTLPWSPWALHVYSGQQPHQFSQIPQSLSSASGITWRWAGIDDGLVPVEEWARPTKITIVGGCSSADVWKELAQAPDRPSATTWKGCRQR